MLVPQAPGAKESERVCLAKAYQQQGDSGVRAEEKSHQEEEKPGRPACLMTGLPAAITVQLRADGVFANTALSSLPPWCKLMHGQSLTPE